MPRISEIYLRVPSDDFFQNDRLEVTDEIEALVNKIRMVMLTRKGELLGDPNFGVDLENYIFETFFDKAAIQREIQTQFALYIPEMLKYDIFTSAYLVEGEFRSDIIIDIFVNQERLIGFKI